MKRAIFRKGLVIIFLLILMMNFFPITIISEQKSNDYSSSNLLASSPLEYAYKCDRLSHIDENYGNPQAIYVVKNYFSTIAFIADNSGGLVIVDVTDSEDPQFISQLSGMVARYIYVSHQTAYVGTNEDVKVIDVSDLKHPRLRKTLDIPLVNAINGKDDLLVVSALFNGAIFFDISSPSNPVEINGYLGSSVYYDMILYENYLFLCHTSLTILDVSNPSSYSVVSQISVGCPFNSRIFLYEDWIFVFGLSAGIFLIDVSDYSNPLIVDQYNDSGLDYISGFVKNDILYSLTEERLELFELGDFSTIEGSDVLPLSIK
ncbi:MAG: LVIVD repeat-containing protein, partial [Candidatus Thorarchaeota archaeon]